MITKPKASDPVITAVIRFLNDWREAHGFSPMTTLPKGKLQQAGRCPIALSMSNGVYDAAVDDQGWIVFHKPSKRQLTSGSAHGDLVSSGEFLKQEQGKLISQFVRDWDKGKYPELVR